MISKHLETILYDSEFYRKLDTNLYEVAFKNGIFDLRTKTFRHGFTVEDYLTNTIDFDYTEPTKEDMDYIKDEVLFKICNANKSHFEYYLNVLVPLQEMLKWKKRYTSWSGLEETTARH